MQLHPPLQTAIFDVAGWARDEEYGIYPVGSRPKELLIAPDPTVSPLIRPGHHYLFKASSHNYPAQYWAEIIAYRVGLVCGIAVPPAFAANDSRTGRPGALIEWFYDMRPGVVRTRFTHGVEYLQKLIPNFDTKTGRQHNWGTVIRILSIAHLLRGLEDPITHWSRILTFDALIGNTDRHQENWGLIYSSSGANTKLTFAPAFDNGTSLGHERTEAALQSFKDPAQLDRYIGKGRHHMRWELEGERLGHFDLLERLTANHPKAREAVRSVASCSLGELHKEIESVSALGRDHDFSEGRSHFVLALIARRHHLLQAF